MNDLDQITCNDYKVGRVSLLSLNKVSFSVEHRDPYQTHCIEYPHLHVST